MVDLVKLAQQFAPQQDDGVTGADFYAAMAAARGQNPQAARLQNAQVQSEQFKTQHAQAAMQKQNIMERLAAATAGMPVQERYDLLRDAVGEEAAFAVIKNDVAARKAVAESGDIGMPEPLSKFGKLEADRRAGFIDDETYGAAMQGVEKSSEKDKKLARLRDQFPELGDQEVIALGDGFMRLGQPDQEGNVSLVNIITGESRYVAGPMASGGQAQQEYSMDDDSGGIDSGNPPLEDIVGDATGPLSNLTALANRGLSLGSLIGADLSVGENMEKARDILRFFNTQALTAFNDHSRLAVWFSQQIEPILVKPGDFTQNPAIATQKIGSLRKKAREKVSGLERQLTRRTTSKRRGEIIDDIASLKGFIESMGTDPNATDSNIPEGISHEDWKYMTPEDRKLWQ